MEKDSTGRGKSVNLEPTWFSNWKERMRLEEGAEAKERLVGATLGECYEPPQGLFEINCMRQIYELLRSLEASRRSRVIKYVSELLGDED